MVSRVNIGVIGVGFWGKNHARVFSELEKAELTAVCDVDSKKVENIAEKYGVSSYTTLENLLKNKDVEAVSICTPTTTHYQIALKAFKYGKHILWSATPKKLNTY